jgi:hypothetical protein
MSKSEQVARARRRLGVTGEVCFHFSLDTGDFFIDVISWTVPVIVNLAAIIQPTPDAVSTVTP